MVLSWLTHTREIPEAPRSITYRYLSIELSRTAFWSLAEIFFVLQIVQNLPANQAGFVFSLQFALVMLLDFPTGGLADSIGHRTVLMIAHGLRAVFFVLLFIANTFFLFIMVVVVAAMSFSQESGALESWFDNNYKLTILENDDDRIHYSAIKGRNTTLRQSISAIAFVVGGFLSSGFGRELLFSISALGFVMIFLLDIFVLKPTPGTVKTSRNSMITNLGEGLKFSVQSRSHAKLFFGLGLMWGSSTVWYVFLLFQTYDAYSGGIDAFTALLRTIIFVLGIPLSILATTLAKRMVNTEKWLIISQTIGGVLFYMGIFLLFHIFPPEEKLDLNKYILLIIAFTITGGMWFTLMEILGNRYFLDFFPDEIRNSMLSFSSSLASLFAIPLQILIGYLVALYSLKIGILMVGILGFISVLMIGFALFELKEAHESKNTTESIESLL